MFVCKNILSRGYLWRKSLINNVIVNSLSRYVNYSGIAVYTNNKNLLQEYRSPYKFLNIHRKWYSKGLLDGDASEFNVKHGKEIKKITDLFPTPRVTLQNISSKTPDKMFDIHFKQNVVAPKGRKKAQVNDWTCTYALLWPEKMKFECTALSKRQAAEKAAIQALHWLYINKRIDATGCPIYNKTVLNQLQSGLNEPLRISIGDKSMERVERIWAEYEDGIKDIYEATFKEAKHRISQTPAVVTKDSTIDEDDDVILENEQNDEIEDISELKQRVHPVYGRHITAPSASTLERREKSLRNKFQYCDEELTPLPIDAYGEEITSTIARSRVTVIVGAAGCGKSTRAPAQVLRRCGAGTAAIVSEPRRVAAIGLAERVANELGEEVGESIGYQVRLHSKPPRPPGGSILYCTSGVLLRRLQTNPGLEGCTHVFIDEAHERDVNTDVTLLLLKKALEINPQLRVIIMSATLDTEVFIRYFDSCPIVEVPGRTFPVEVSYLDDIQKKLSIRLPNALENCKKEDGKPQLYCQEVTEVIKAVDRKDKEGAILVFLPGWAEIKHTKQLLDEHYGESSAHMILPVHSRLSTTEQTKMFAKPPPGVRKIVLATNVAETSITIPDVVYVIDSGAHKENRIKEGTGTASLETVWVSLAGAKQRAGRAGRVQPGHCYRLYTKEKEAELAPHTTPEILRIPLEQTVLDLKTYAPDDKIENFLSQLPEPPSKESIKFAVKDLIDMGALTPSEKLTRLGGILSSLTLHPRLGLSVVHSAIIGNLVSIAHMTALCSQNTELFVAAADRRDEIREIKRKFNATSDHSALNGIQEQFEGVLQEGGRNAVEQFCQRYGIRSDRLHYVRSLSKLHIEQTLSTGLVPPTVEAEDLTKFSGVDELTSATLLSAANSLLTTRKHVKTKGKLATVVNTFTSTGDRAHISTESVNYGITKRTQKTSLLAYFGGYHSTERRALVVYKTSVVSPHTALIFCMGDIKKEILNDSNGQTTILSIPRHRLAIHIPTSQADHILKAREMLWKTLQYHIERDVRSLDYDVYSNVSRFKVRLIKTIGRILVEAEREFVQGKARIDVVEDFG